MLHFSCTTINNNENVGSVTLWSPARPCCLVIMSHYFRYIVSPCSSSSHVAAWAVWSGSCALCPPRALCPDWRAHSARLMSRPSPALTTTHPTLGMSRVQGPGRTAPLRHVNIEVACLDKPSKPRCRQGSYEPGMGC